MAARRLYPGVVGKVFEGIDARLREWIGAQPLFFVASAPLAATGHVNVSPKGPIGTLRVLDERTVAYLDVVGSGAETIAPLRENGRLGSLRCAFDGPPRIVRLHARAEVIPVDDERFAALVERCAFEQPAVAGARRAVVLANVTRIADSCGYGVPLMRLQGLRPHADAWAQKKVRVGGEEALRDYQREHNATSLDGLPAVELDPR
jgi:predicted pyridoxine 5'-phosphate oxidase superfamily flavin-nucleotide-binding protein